ncbi:MAG: DUF4274 domain-containing protein [Alphaproteobacteria bacterium]|nr:DUF4274 domain-containing protein [Alphaproteobacteria bacterium]
MTPHELHRYVRAYNWDDGVEPILALLDDPAVERATALLVYWLLQGPWHTFLPESFGPHPHDAAIRMLQDRLLANEFPSGTLAFDAIGDLGVTRVQLLRLSRAGMPEGLARVG